MSNAVVLWHAQKSNLPLPADGTAPSYILEALEPRRLLSLDSGNYTADMDPNFGGTVRFTPYAAPWALAAGPQGKVYASVSLDDPDGSYDYGWGLARFNADGTPDASFGVQGALTVISPNLQPAQWTNVVDLFVRDNGKVLAVAESGPIDQYGGQLPGAQLGFYQFNSDGTPDGSFGTNGVTTVSLPAKATAPDFNNVYMYQAFLDADGGVTAVGLDAANIVQVRVGADGSVLTSAAAPSGVSYSPVSAPDGLTIDGDYGGLLAVVPGPDGGETVYLSVTAPGFEDLLGSASVGGAPQGALLRMDLAPDASVMASRIVQSGFVFSVTPDASGRLYVVGDGADVERLNPDDTLDTTFGQDGIVDTPMFAEQVLPLANGKVLVGWQGTQYIVPAAIRLNADGSPDPTFANGSAAEGFEVAPNCPLLELPDGSILQAVPGADGISLSKLNADGGTLISQEDDGGGDDSGGESDDSATPSSDATVPPANLGPVGIVVGESASASDSTILATSDPRLFDAPEGGSVLLSSDAM
jgi:uncharacterized delta-60 repeat protein